MVAHRACASMRMMAAMPVRVWMPKPVAADCPAMALMVRVPVVSQARPAQKSNT